MIYLPLKLLILISALIMINGCSCYKECNNAQIFINSSVVYEHPDASASNVKKKEATATKDNKQVITTIHAPILNADYPPFVPTVKNINVALVLGGGGAKGISHVGVLKVLEDHKIPIDLIVGASVGSAIGALYADEPNVKNLKKKVMTVGRWDILDPSLSDSLKMLTALKGPIRGVYYENFLSRNLKSKHIESLKIPFMVVTTDIATNQLYVIRSGPITPAVHASSAIPPFFSPVKIYGRTLVDGGVRAPVPVEVARQFQPKIVIAVDIGAPPPRLVPTNMLDLTYRSIWIFYYELARRQAHASDIEIRPKLDGIGTFDDDKKEQLYLAGIDAANEVLPLLKKRLTELEIPFGEANEKH